MNKSIYMHTYIYLNKVGKASRKHQIILNLNITKVVKNEIKMAFCWFYFSNWVSPIKVVQKYYTYYSTSS